jgi:DNA polymerase III epsilon subunit-like protein
MSFIVIDIETTGLIATEHCMVSLGAVDYDTGDEFYKECRIYKGSTVDDFAMKVNGFTLAQVTDSNKLLPHEVYVSFVDWAKNRPKILAGQQIASFDALFLHEYAGGKVGFEEIFSRRMVDLHSVAFARFGKSMSLDGILKELGLEPEPKPHNALTGARLEALAFKLLLKETTYGL